MINRMQHYILKEDHTVEAVDLMTWANWFEGNPTRLVKQEHVGDWYVSTVFLGLDYNYATDETSPPILFETMVFDHSRKRTYKLGNKIHTSHPDVYQERYHTYDEALNAHNKLVDALKLGGSVEGMYVNENTDDAS